MKTGGRLEDSACFSRGEGVMQEAVEQGTIRFAVTTASLSGFALLKGCQAYLEMQRKKKIKHGYMTVNELIKKDQGVSTIDVSKEKILDFANIAEKYGVDYAARYLPDPEGPRYVVFFKAKDKDAIDAIVREYTVQLFEDKEKPKVRQKLEKNRAKVKQEVKKNREKSVKQGRQKSKNLDKARRTVRRIIKRERVL